MDKSKSIGEKMKIQCKRENLLKGLNIVSRMVKTRATLPVLSNIMLATDQGRIKLIATDLEAAISTWVGGKVDEEGAITIPARTLVEYITTTSDDAITIESQESDIRIKSSHYNATIKGISAEEFPIIPKVQGDPMIKIKASVLKQAILSVSPAAAMDEMRPVLAGILLRSVEDKLKMVATDSYRLAEYTINSKVGEKIDIVLPQRTINELARVLPSDESMIEVLIGDNQAEFRFTDINFVSRQIEGAFPEYEQIIPKSFVYEFTASKNELSEAIKSANIFARESGNNLKLETKENEVAISAATAALGEAVASLKVDSKGDSLSVAFNSKYILDALGVLGDNVTFKFAGALNPGLICSKDMSEFVYIIMPLRTDN